MVDDSVAPTALTSPLLPVPLPQCLRGVLFDLDGTLIDPRAAISGALSYAFVQMGRPVPPHDVPGRSPQTPRTSSSIWTPACEA